MSNPGFVNLTKHPVSFLDKQGINLYTIEPSGDVCRVETVETESKHKNPLFEVKVPVLKGVYGLPENEVEDTFYIVSMLVIEALKKAGVVRSDVIAPATGPNDGAVRNDKGYVLYVTKFNGLI